MPHPLTNGVKLKAVYEGEKLFSQSMFLDAVFLVLVVMFNSLIVVGFFV